MSSQHHSALAQEEIDRRLQIWRDNDHSSRAASEELGIDRRTMDRFLLKYAHEEELAGYDPDMVGTITQTDIIEYPLPKRGKVFRYICTSAQNNTFPHKGVWKNLKAYADHIGADILVGPFMYNLNNYKGGRKDEAPHEAGSREWAKEFQPYVSDDIVALAPDLYWCGALQVSPTATSPLSGLSTYSGKASMIVPHPRIAMQPVPTMRGDKTKHLYTTGCATLKNYIRAKAGQKAEFHHSFGALLVEVDHTGEWWTRQLVTNDAGTFCDYPYKVSRGTVRETASVAALQWGDCHVANMDKTIRKAVWRSGGILDWYQPKYQIFHDLVDGESHNHHAKRDHHHQYHLHCTGRSNIADEFAQARQFVDVEAHRDWCQSVVVWSNHDEFIRKWLQSTDYKLDHVNAELILELELAAYKSVRMGKPANLFLTALNCKKADVLTDDAIGLEIEGVQCGLHGHAGTGGSRGNINQFARAGAKTMTGHSHKAAWVDGATSAGTFSKLDMGYNKGLSDWSHTFTVLYEGGKRQQVTINKKGKFRA